MKERGSALISVILVVLVLTMVGLAALVYTSMEDRISGNDRLLKEALYAAEAGLRVGEGTLGSTLGATNTISNLMSRVSVGSTPAVAPGVPLQPVNMNASSFDLGHLGTYLATADGTELSAQPVTYTDGAASTSDRAFYSVYIRNNSDDTNGTPTTDQDGKFTMISVGYILAPSGQVTAVKILAEGFDLGDLFALTGQKDWNQGGTNAN